ncbi:MAG: NAD-dependent epimerase/dehydratase family protein [Acidimicrobiales bacterium]
MARVLVVGGAGYIGGWLTDKLVEMGHDVRVYDLLLYEERYLKDVDFVFGDVLDYEHLHPHLDWADTAIWLAALVGDPACALNPGVTQKINVDTVDWLCRTFRGRIIFPSTCSVYGANDNEVDEESATDPLSLYAQAKLEAESVIMRRRPDSLIFRLATIAGVGDSYSRIRMDLVVNLLVMRAKLVGHLQVFGGQQYRPMLHVRDVATAIVPQIESDASGIFNLGAENDTIADIADRIVKRVGAGEIERVDMPFQDTRNYRVSFERVEQELAFKPEYSVDDAIDQIAWLIDNGRVKDMSLAAFSNLHALRPYLCPEEIPLGREIRRPHSLSRHAGPR